MNTCTRIQMYFQAHTYIYIYIFTYTHEQKRCEYNIYTYIVKPTSESMCAWQTTPGVVTLAVRENAKFCVSFLNTQEFIYPFFKSPHFSQLLFQTFPFFFTDHFN